MGDDSRIPTFHHEGSGAHEHTPATAVVLRQREGVPYEVEQTVCASCRAVLAERLLRRTAA